MNVLRALAVAGVVGWSAVVWGDVKLASLFQDHMVLQREQEGVPVWGTAEAGEEVTVTIAEQSKRVVADARGNWMVKLDEMHAGGPWGMEVKGKNVIKLADVMVGEVWVCSGQSNMDMQVVQSKDGVGEVARANWPYIRLFKVPFRPAATEQLEVPGKWVACSPETVGDFSAAAYFFGREIHQKLDGVAVGLIESCVGGTPAESWTPEGELAKHVETKPILAQWEKDRAAYPALKASFDQQMKEWKEKYETEPKRPAETKGWEKEGLDDSGWGKVMEPGAWQEKAGWKHNGVVWLRKEIMVPAEWAGKDLVLNLGRIDDKDITYFDGQEVGRTWKENPLAVFVRRKYTVPGKLVKAGKNIVAVRVWDQGGVGGLMSEPGEMRAMSEVLPGEPVSLEGEWKWKVEKQEDVPAQPQEPRGPGNAWTPAALWNGMIRPLIPYGIRGVIWYQGESNADRAEQYQTLFPAMISAWRKEWGEGEFPFIFVQIANFGLWKPPATQPSDSTWAELREAQLMTLKKSVNTAMAVTIDIGETNDIHPKNKQEVGRRLALAALANVYGKQEIAYSGPLLESWKIEKDRVRLKFRPGAERLEQHGDGMKGFAVAGEDHKFYWAQAWIAGQDEVMVKADQVKKPVAVRYGWGDDPKVGLFNSAGLPASPFRTDSWEGVTTGKR
ncbi:MAG TPA: sialate O-acetylesterase [Tepidisphaeraceae bacterium]|jgi:sialate O-acetylesterase|nr:sialate O-acetylesterase [Tepidisphaeraceae bacterium]